MMSLWQDLGFSYSNNIFQLWFKAIYEYTNGLVCR